ncbi:hypothetical protein ACFOET_11040 [Parapedobacter deserti]|uniref:Uncharacterized protein n=1 Tax=Parapedobacter deserti TaxID=1912957 RepID=A0ABV7JMS3_9SPHI
MTWNKRPEAANATKTTTAITNKGFRLRRPNNPATASNTNGVIAGKICRKSLEEEE